MSQRRTTLGPISSSDVAAALAGRGGGMDDSLRLSLGNVGGHSRASLGVPGRGGAGLGTSKGGAMSSQAADR